MRITLGQINPVVGDIQGNLDRIKKVLEGAQKEGSDLAVFPELSLIGYPPKDLLDRPWFVERVQRALSDLRKTSKKYPSIGIIIGAPLLNPNNKPGKKLHNSAVLIYRGRFLHCQHKYLLPNYDVFDETRYFEPAAEIKPVVFKREKLGISVCEDVWNIPEFWPQGQIYAVDPISLLAQKGATLFINISASPFYVGKEELRYRLLQAQAKKHKTSLVYVNQVGGNDELIFDGRSICFNKQGEVASVLASFREDVQTIETEFSQKIYYQPQAKIDSLHQALVLGIQDYVRKCGFSKVVVGLSGGIDSAVTCCLAVEAVGKDNVLGVAMPSPYSSKGSVEDARKLAENLAVRFRVVPISPIFRAYLATLQKHFRGTERGVAEENIQARIRGNILMAFSNKFGYLLLSTGNKSELAVGYCTLYGDMSGGLDVLSDVPKTMVYELARFINRDSHFIPSATIKKAPSAELKPNQVDQDTLPPYPVLDQILDYYVENALSPQEIVRKKLNKKTVAWVARSVDRNEYKRYQAPPGLKVTTKAFGFGRRMPIAAKYEI